MSRKRAWKAGTKDYGRHYPSGTPILGCVFWLIAFVLVLIGIGALVAGGHHHVILAVVLWVGAGLLVAQTFVVDNEDQ